MFQQLIHAANGDIGQMLTWQLNYFDAIDTDNQLCLSTTNGRTRGARKWSVHRILQDGTRRGKKDHDSGCVCFRAWDLIEAIEKSNTDTRLVNRIKKLNDI